MLYFKRVAICVPDALRILFFYYHNTLKTICFISKWIRACNFLGLGKTLTIKISLKHNFTPTCVIEYLTLAHTAFTVFMFNGVLSREIDALAT